jgi:hypothetical protein
MPPSATRQPTARYHTAAGRNAPPLRLFCETTLTLEGGPVRFEDRPYIDAILAATNRNLVIRAGRQVEKSTFLAFRIAFELCRPGSRVLLVCPRQQQAKHLMESRFRPLLESSPLLQRRLGGQRGRSSFKDMRFGNQSQLFVRSAFNSADSVRGVSADLLVCDEYQDVAAGFLPVLKETLAHSSRPRTILTGTPKEVTNHLEDAFALSTARHWMVRCEACDCEVLPDPRSIGADCYACGACGHPIDWQRGAWVATNARSSWGEGFWLPQVIAPWVTSERFLEKAAEYDRDKLLNEVFGLPTMHGTLAITRAELEACCASRPMAASSNDLPAEVRGSVMLGIDWGSGLTGQAAVVVASECLRSQRLRIWYWGVIGNGERPLLDDVVALCGRFGVTSVWADARGGGAHENRALWMRLGGQKGPSVAGLEYADNDGPNNRDGNLLKKSIDKTKWIGGLCTRIRSKLIEFPTLQDCQEGFDHVGSEQVEFDEQSRKSTYRAGDNRPDDLLHPLVYVLAGSSVTPRFEDSP